MPYLDIGALQSGGLDIGAIEAASGAIPEPIVITGTAGGRIQVRGGSGGAVGNPVAGQVGGRIRVRGGTGGRAGLLIAGVSGGRIQVRGGVGGGLTPVIRGGAGGRVRVRGGVTGAVLPATARNVTVFHNGADISSYVLVPITRTLQISGGSKSACQFKLTNKHRGAIREPLRPATGDEVVIYEGTDRFFAGIVDNTEEFSFGGTSGLIEIAVKCVDYGALCDRIYVGRKYEVYAGGLATILMGQIAIRYLSRFGITGCGGYEPGTNLGPQVFNWETVTECYNKITAAINAEWIIDFHRNLRIVHPESGLSAAPFDLADNDGNWADMRVVRSAARRANRVGVRNSQDLKTLWTDTFTGDGETRVFLPMAELSGKPIIRVNGADQVVTELGVYDLDWDWLWQQWSVYRNQAKPAPGPGDIIEVLYPSPLSHVEWAEDAEDVAANGPWELIEEVRDMASIEAMQAAAQGFLARAKVVPVSISFRTDRKGLEPGQTLNVNLTRPYVPDLTLLIQQVDSEEQGKRFFRHTVKASTAKVTTPVSVAQLQATARRQPRDRVTEVIRFTLAETIPGSANPGLATDDGQQAVGRATKSGVLRECSLYFRSGATTDPVEIDVLKNGVSIFGSTKMVWPEGGSAGGVLNYIFASDPLLVGKGEVFTLNVLKADAAAKDGILELVVVG